MLSINEGTDSIPSMHGILGLLCAECNRLCTVFLKKLFLTVSVQKCTLPQPCRTQQAPIIWRGLASRLLCMDLHLTVCWPNARDLHIQ